MKKIMMLAMGLCFAGQVCAQNLVTDSYGKWYGHKEGVVSVSKYGLDEFNRNCPNTKIKYKQKTSRYKGSELLEQLNDAIKDYQEIEGYDAKDLKAIKSKIKSNANYHAIIVSQPECMEGAIVFVQLEPKTALYLEEGWVNVFSIIRKK